jgi:hypothetical protein
VSYQHPVLLCFGKVQVLHTAAGRACQSGCDGILLLVWWLNSWLHVMRYLLPGCMSGCIWAMYTIDHLHMKHATRSRSKVDRLLDACRPV